MKILVSGASGLVGSALVGRLVDENHEVIRLTRSSENSPNTQITWDPLGGKIDPSSLEGLNAVIHLAGENIAAKRWSPAQKAKIRDSRVDGTRLLCQTLANSSQPPQAFLCASAIGYYGDRGADVLREESLPGTGFLPGVCRDWEKATQPVADKGIRTVCMRFGVILDRNGGALPKMLPPFQMGVGGIVGSGAQYMSWITLDDVVRAICHILQRDSLSGPVNVVSPTPATNREFTKALGRTLRRPTLFPLPAFAARLLLGEMADGLLLASARVYPAALLASEFEFAYPLLPEALRRVLGG